MSFGEINEISRRRSVVNGNVERIMILQKLEKFSCSLADDLVMTTILLFLLFLFG